MKTFLKIFFAIIILLLISLVLIPVLFKDKILTKVKTEINNNINAKVDFADYSLSMFRNFPNLSIVMNQFQVIGVDEFKNDTLASINTAAIAVDILSVIKGDKIQINTINLEYPRIHLLVLKNGKANWDIAKSGKETTSGSESSQFKIGLKKYSLSDGYVYYNDESMGMSMEMQGLNHNGTGDFTQDLFTLRTTTIIDTLDLSYGGISYFNKVKANLIADLEMDMVHSKYTFSKNEIKLNELLFGVDGFIAMPGNDIDMDLKFDVKENDFKNFISMIPGVYSKGFDKVQSSGKMTFNGFVKGKYNATSMPAFNIALNVDKGQFKYPDLPTSINNVNIKLALSNPDGVPDHTLIDLASLHAEMGSQPFDAHFKVSTPVSDANINGGIKGRLNLTEISRMVPLDPGTSMSGTLDADVTANGRISYIENKQYENFNANGKLLISDLIYKSNDFTQGATIKNCELIFNPKNITLNNLDLITGKTDIHATGWIDNLFSYLFKKNELLKGTVNITSKVIDVNQFMNKSGTTTSTDSSAMSVFEVPSGIDFLVTATTGKIYYDDLVLENAKGNIAIRNNTLGLNDFSFNMLEGKISMDGVYETKDIKKPFFFFNIDLANLNIPKVYEKFVAVQKLAPIAEKCMGNFSSVFNVKGNLDQKMEPVITSFTGDGKLSTLNVIINNFKPLVKVADALKMDQFKQLNVGNIKLAFKFEDGRVKIDQFPVKLAGINSLIQGSNGFDQTIDYDINLQIPSAMLGGAANNVISGLFTKANQAAGSNLSMGKEVNVKVKIGGTVTDPKVETGIKDIASSAIDNLKDQLKNELENKKQELQDKAKAEADKLKNEAMDKANAEKDKLKNEAAVKAKAEADRLKKEAADKAKKDAQDKLKNLFGKPK